MEQQTAAAALGERQRPGMQLVRENLHDPGGTETALAAPHARAGAALDPVKAFGPGTAADGIPDLALGDALAAADDLTAAFFDGFSVWVKVLSVTRRHIK